VVGAAHGHRDYDCAYEDDGLHLPLQLGLVMGRRQTESVNVSDVKEIVLSVSEISIRTKIANVIETGQWYGLGWHRRRYSKHKGRFSGSSKLTLFGRDL
jgi:hypothetical protein